jgi:hypothetical protein
LLRPRALMHDVVVALALTLATLVDQTIVEISNL